jgi:hypothetical protein
LKVSGLLRRGFERATIDTGGEPYDLTRGNPDRDAVTYLVGDKASLTICRSLLVRAWFARSDRKSERNPDRRWPSLGDHPQGQDVPPRLRGLDAGICGPNANDAPVAASDLDFQAPS